VLVVGALFHGFRKDSVAVVVIEYEDVLVATAGGDRELAGEIS
jgi:hypothetical protein